MNGQEAIGWATEATLNDWLKFVWDEDRIIKWLDAGLWYHLMLRKEELEQYSSALDEAIQRLGRGIY